MYIILDSPWDTDENLIETLMFLSKLPTPYQITIFSLVFFPGTDTYRKAKKEGIIKKPPPLEISDEPVPLLLEVVGDVIQAVSDRSFEVEEGVGLRCHDRLLNGKGPQNAGSDRIRMCMAERRDRFGELCDLVAVM